MIGKFDIYNVSNKKLTAKEQEEILKARLSRQLLRNDRVWEEERWNTNEFLTAGYNDKANSQKINSDYTGE